MRTSRQTDQISEIFSFSCSELQETLRKHVPYFGFQACFVVPPTPTLMEGKIRAIVAVTFFLVLSLPGGDASEDLDCGATAAEPPGGTRFLSAVLDTQTAQRSQRQHLEALFNR